jgi:DNA repair ATPase RecN
MRTFWDQVVALVEQGDRPPGAREARLIGHESAMPQVGARSAALKAQCEDIGRSLDHLERLRGLFQSFLSPVSELVLEFEACNGRLEETTAKLAALEEAHRDLAARHAAALEDRDRLAEQGRAFAESEAALRAATARCAALEARLATRIDQEAGAPGSLEGSVKGGERGVAT